MASHPAPAPFTPSQPPGGMPTEPCRAPGCVRGVVSYHDGEGGVDREACPECDGTERVPARPRCGCGDELLAPEEIERGQCFTCRRCCGCGTAVAPEDVGICGDCLEKEHAFTSLDGAEREVA